MYRGITTFNCTICGHIFKSHDIEYCASALSVPQRCPNCGSVRTLPDFWIEAGGIESGTQLYASIWEEIDERLKKQEERRFHREEKMKAKEKTQRKKQAKKRKHMSRKQREAYDKKRTKKAAKRSKATIDATPSFWEGIIDPGPTWYPPGTPLKLEK